MIYLGVVVSFNACVSILLGINIISLLQENTHYESNAVRLGQPCWTTDIDI